MPTFPVHPTQNLFIKLLDHDGTAIAGATFSAELTLPDYYLGQIIPPVVHTTTTDTEGKAYLALFPNSLGSVGTEYIYRVKHPTGKTILDGVLTMPNATSALTDIIEGVTQEFPGGSLAWSDSFDNYNDEDPLVANGNWTNDAFWGGMSIEAARGTAIATSGDGDSVAAYWSADAPTASQWAAIVVEGSIGLNGAMCRYLPTVGTAYFVFAGDTNTVQIWRFVAGSGTQLSTVDIAGTIVSGQTEIALHVATRPLPDTGVVLKSYVDGVLVDTYIDYDSTRILTAGFVGIHAFGGNAGVRSFRGFNGSNTL